MNKNQVLLSLVIISFIGMSSVYLDVHKILRGDEKVSTPVGEVKDGEVKQYTKDNKLKTIVNYKQGVKHGTSYLFHEDGETILLEMPYINGKREGISKKNYANGQLYAATSYLNDELHGTRKLYYSNGQLKAEIKYGYGLYGLGSKEYLLDGTEKDELAITSTEQKNIIWLDTSAPCKRQTFYIGKLVEDQYLDPLNEEIRLVMSEQGRFYVDTEVYTESYLKYQDIICACETKQGNTLVLKKRLF